MQIREQGKQVQLIRSPYDKTKKRCVQKVVHHFEQRHAYSADGMSKYLSAEQLADLSDDEKKTLADWLKAKADTKATDDRKYSIMFIASRISDSADAILADGVSAEQASKIWAAMAVLAKTLKKAGHPKPAKTPKEQAEDDQEAAKVDPAQASLLT